MNARNLIDLDHISQNDLDEVIRLAGIIKENPSYYIDDCHGNIMATLFYEPSTRTQMSFQTAMLRLGGKLIGFDNPSNSSVSKGESLKDTIRVVSNYADIIVIRNSFEGAALAASMYSRCPIINAGDGGHLHPTHTLTDLVTLSYEKGRLDHLTVGLCGDNKNGRHPLADKSSHKMRAIGSDDSTPELRVPDYIIEHLKEKAASFYLQ
jgi:aspartate carbamoyltransferase catalytic subunit